MAIIPDQVVVTRALHFALPPAVCSTQMLSQSLHHNLNLFLLKLGTNVLKNNQCDNISFKRIQNSLSNNVPYGGWQIWMKKTPENIIIMCDKSYEPD